MKPRLKKQYDEKFRVELQKELGYSTVMAVPRLHQITLNSGMGKEKGDKMFLEGLIEVFRKISGQKPVVTKARKAVSSFGLAKGDEIGVKVTLRGDKMWYFFDKLINIVLPRMKDFHGLLSSSFDGSGNYSLGIEEHSVFPEIDPNEIKKDYGLQVTLGITSLSDSDSKKFLNKFNFPFAKDGDNSTRS